MKQNEGNALTLHHSNMTTAMKLCFYVLFKKLYKEININPNNANSARECTNIKIAVI
jgi:hypothetical protein